MCGYLTLLHCHLNSDCVSAFLAWRNQMQLTESYVNYSVTPGATYYLPEQQSSLKGIQILFLISPLASKSISCVVLSTALRSSILLLCYIYLFDLFGKHSLIEYFGYKSVTRMYNSRIIHYFIHFNAYIIFVMSTKIRYFPMHKITVLNNHDANMHIGLFISRTGTIQSGIQLSAVITPYKPFTLSYKVLYLEALKRFLCGFLRSHLAFSQAVVVLGAAHPDTLPVSAQVFFEPLLSSDLNCQALPLSIDNWLLVQRLNRLNYS